MAVGAFLFSLVAPAVWWSFRLKAGEPVDNVIVAANEANTSQHVPTIDESWGEVDTPVSALSPSIGPSRVCPDLSRDQGTRALVRNRTQAFSHFHAEYIAGLRPELRPEFRTDGFYGTLCIRWSSWVTDADRWVTLDVMNWYLLEGFNGVWFAEGFSIEPFRLMTDVHEMKAYPNPVSNNSRLFVNLIEPNSLNINRVPTFSGFLNTSPAFLNAARGQFSSLLWNAFNDRSVSLPEWRIERLELIGLLKHAAPVVYSGNHVPKIDELQAAPTAPLNAFEQSAVDRLKSKWSENVVVNETGDEIQIVGGLRASKSCIACHAVESGQLLGALTYRLTRISGSETEGNQNAHSDAVLQSTVRYSQAVQASHRFVRENRNWAREVSEATTDLNDPASALTPENFLGDIRRSEAPKTVPLY